MQKKQQWQGQGQQQKLKIVQQGGIFLNMINWKLNLILTFKNIKDMEKVQQLVQDVQKRLQIGNFSLKAYSLIQK